MGHMRKIVREQRDLDDRYLGQQIKYFRKSRMLSHIVLARALGVSKEYLISVEANQRPITAALEAKFRRAFDIDIKSVL